MFRWPSASPNRLYQNIGDGFVEVELYPEEIEPYTYAAAWIQPEEGEPPLLYNINDFGYERVPNRLFQLSEGQHQPLYSTGLDVAMYGMGVAVNDINEDGQPDVLISDFEKVHLYLSDANGTWYDGTHASSVLVNPSLHRFSWGVNIFDMDNDGLLDLGLGPISIWRNVRDDNCAAPAFENTVRASRDGGHLGCGSEHISRGSVVADLDMDGFKMLF